MRTHERKSTEGAHRPRPLMARHPAPPSERRTVCDDARPNLVECGVQNWKWSTFGENREWVGLGASCLIESIPAVRRLRRTVTTRRSPASASSDAACGASTVTREETLNRRLNNGQPLIIAAPSPSTVSIYADTADRNRSSIPHLERQKYISCHRISQNTTTLSSSPSGPPSPLPYMTSSLPSARAACY